MSEFTVRGSLPARSGEQEFEKRVEAPNENGAVERTYAAFGAQHGLTRSRIDVTEVDA
jgi:large subunit ribosomal protein LX